MRNKTIYICSTDNISVLDLDKEEDFLMMQLARIRLEKTRRQQRSTRSVFDLGASTSQKDYYRDPHGSEGGSGTKI